MSTTTKTAQAAISVKAVGDERKVSFVVSSSGLDRDYERVDVKSLRIPLKGGGFVVAKDLDGSQAVDVPWLLNHSFDVEDVIGSVREARYDAARDELVFDFGVSKRAKAQDMLLLIEEGHLDNAVSITMSDYAYDEETKSILDAELIEVSLVFRGSNKDARLLAVKSLIKGENMAEAKSLAEKKAELEALSKEIAEEEAQATPEPTPEEVPAPRPEQPEPQKPAEVEVETPTPEAPEAEQDPTKVEPAEEVEEHPPQDSKTIKQETPNMSKDIAVKQVLDAPKVEPEVVETPTLTKDAQRALFVEQFQAAINKDAAKLAELNKKAFEADSRKTKIMGEGSVGVDMSGIYQTEVVSRDIREAYDNAGKLSSLVNRIDILGAEKWKGFNQVDGAGFRPVGFGGTKDEDNPTFTTQLIEPHEWAIIVAWYDAMARKTPLAVYTQMVRYIAKMYVKLEDKIILSYAGGTNDGEVYEATGLQPLLTTAARIVTWDGTATALQTALGETYGLLETDDNVTLVANRKEWGRLATLVATDGRALFTQVGEQVSAGALGSFNVIVTNAVSDGNVVVGAFNDYDLVTRGGLETLFSREATVGSVNLYTQDASALRANADISGAPRAIKSFALLQFEEPA